MSVVTEVVRDPARACAAMMFTAAIGGGDIVLAGGSTPKAANQHFAGLVTGAGLDLARTTLWMGDERCVEPADERSNYRMIKESLLDPLGGATSPVVHRIRGELGADPAADDYERTLRYAGPPVFDLVLLGIGPDGHTASLFPRDETLAERTRLVVSVPKAGLEPFVPRVSLTFTTLARARRIVVLAEGESKAEPIVSAFGPGARPDPGVPSSMLLPLGAEILLLIDPAAASALGSGGAR